METSGSLNVKCGNCDWTGTDSEMGAHLEELVCLGERLDAGSEVPAGECPECGALAYVVKPADQVKSSAAGLLVIAFAMGQHAGGKVDWDDVSAALEAAKRELGSEMAALLERECGPF